MGDALDTAWELARSMVRVPVDRYPDPASKPIRFYGTEPSFVWPNLSNFDHVADSRLILIEAPGAVGKTTLARSIAGETGWPVVNAAMARVGDYTFTGLLHDAFGIGSTFISDVVAGRCGVIIDALDEAHLKAGGSNFDAFIENVGSIARSDDSSEVCLIVLSRPDTAAIVKAKLDQDTTPYSGATLDYFTYPQACAFIECYLNERISSRKSGNYDVAKRNPQPFAELRDSLFKEIIGSLLPGRGSNDEEVWADVANFVGYAPVLGVFAESLAVANPHKERIAGIAAGSSTEAILVKIIDEILEREQTKFQDQVLARLWSQLPADIDWHNPESCYSPLEQSLRLVAKVYNKSRLPDPPPEHLPNVIRPQYERQAQQFIDDHPFVVGKNPVNVVFGDFIKATASVSRDVALRLDRGVPASVETPGQFYLQFAHRFAPASDPIEAAEGRKIATVNLEVLPLLAESTSQMEQSRHSNFFSYVDRGEADGFAIFSIPAGAGQRSYLDFEVMESSGILYFPRTLSLSLIFTERLLVLGDKGDRFTLGPAVSIHGSSISIDASALSVESRLPNGMEWETGIVNTGDVIHSPNLRTVDVHDEDMFSVYGDTWPVLYPYQRDSPKPEHELQADYVDLRAILVSFGRSAHGHPSAYYERLDQRIVKSNATRTRLLQALIAKRIVYREESLYRLDTEKLGALGVGLQSINLGYPDSGMLGLIRLLREGE